jgi:ADP-ribose pyrophosphatase YjhB (NUDIX family)
LVLPGVDPSRLDARSEAAFSAGLRDTLPFQRFRLVPSGDALALEGKINPWVRLVDDAGIDQIQLSDAPSDARPDGDHWTWVGPVTELQPSIRRPPGAADLGPAPRGYTVPWLDEGRGRDSSTVVLPMKTKFYGDSDELQYAGGLPGLPGGAIERGETLGEGIRREFGEEVRGPDGRAFSQTLIAKDVAHEQVGEDNLYFAESSIAPIHDGTPTEAVIPGDDTRGWIAVDITTLGVTPADPLDTIAVQIANECLKRMGAGWKPTATVQLQQYFRSQSVRFLTSNVRMRLELVYDRTVADITAGRPAAGHATAQAAHRDYIDEVGRLRIAPPVAATNRAATAAQADYAAGLVEIKTGREIADTANPAARAARDDYAAAIDALRTNGEVAGNDAALAARATYQAIQRQPAPRLGATGTALLQDPRFAGFIAIGLLALGIAFWQWISRTMDPQQRS